VIWRDLENIWGIKKTTVEYPSILNITV
jgi:hypothetical protein